MKAPSVTAYSLPLLLVVIITIYPCSTMLTVRGKIKFTGGKTPESLPDGSTLTVKFQDTSMMDAPAINLGTSIQKINGYKSGQELSYEIKNAKKPEYGEASLSAVINAGWAPYGNEWLRKGDYLNDCHHPVEIEDGKTEYNDCHVEIKQYN